jgi:hypothetical protein
VVASSFLFQYIQVNVYAPSSIVVTRGGEMAVFVAGQCLTCSEHTSVVNGRTADINGKI